MDQLYKWRCWRSMTGIQRPMNAIKINSLHESTGLQGKTSSWYITRMVCSNISNESATNRANSAMVPERQTPKAEFARFDRDTGDPELLVNAIPNLGYINHACRTPGRVNTLLAGRTFFVHSFGYQALRFSLFLNNVTASSAEHVLRALYSFTRHSGHFSRSSNVFFLHPRKGWHICLRNYLNIAFFFQG